MYVVLQLDAPQALSNAKTPSTAFGCWCCACNHDSRRTGVPRLHMHVDLQLSNRAVVLTWPMRYACRMPHAACPFDNGGSSMKGIPDYTSYTLQPTGHVA